MLPFNFPNDIDRSTCETHPHGDRDGDDLTTANIIGLSVGLGFVALLLLCCLIFLFVTSGDRRRNKDYKLVNYDE